MPTLADAATLIPFAALARRKTDRRIVEEARAFLETAEHKM